MGASTRTAAVAAADGRRALVFGGSGQIGAALVTRLRGAGWQVEALTREARRSGPGLRWLQGEFARLPPLPQACDAIFSCGPLDLFSLWYADAAIECPRVIAFGSTSMATKRAAADAGERELAQRLAGAETRILDAARARGAAATLLRPTLIYGAGRDRNLSRIAALAARSGVFLLPRGACGLRQPVHVEDLAQAAWSAVDRPASHGRGYALPGGETLPYRDMVARTLAALAPRPRLLELPAPLFRLALAAAHAAGRLRGLPPGAVARMREDLVFDMADARRDLGYAPRAFAPTAEMLAPPP
ncbi:nucleoside-diphosphate sugar epimerase [Luteimonas sp. SJ-92]|uniref:Nucleoside-diphosphate sugar epimerase n=1 Tax=Luteimonas salinisoli TaxID=2752307 RepID=A0A853J9J9_9GAMM|nr:nucleoside-diphosphate sugar epimerase [Luteimonas salinisoli]